MGSEMCIRDSNSEDGCVDESLSEHHLEVSGDGCTGDGVCWYTGIW